MHVHQKRQNTRNIKMITAGFITGPTWPHYLKTKSWPSHEPSHGLLINSVFDSQRRSRTSSPKMTATPILIVLFSTPKTPQNWKTKAMFLHTRQENCLPEFSPEVLPGFGHSFFRKNVWDKATFKPKPQEQTHRQQPHSQEQQQNKINKIRTQTQE